MCWRGANRRCNVEVCHLTKSAFVHNVTLLVHNVTVLVHNVTVLVHNVTVLVPNVTVLVHNVKDDVMLTYACNFEK